MKRRTDFWNGLPNGNSYGFSLFPILIYSKRERYSTIDYRFEIGIFFWFWKIEWATNM